MTCRQMEGYWEEWLGGAAPPELERHLEACAACRQRAAELTRTSHWLALLQQEPVEPDPAFWVRLREQLEQREQAAQFWSALAWMAGRAALALAVLLVLFTLGVVLRPPEPALADFDAPQAYLESPTGVPVANGQLNRDQVVLTLVAYTEPQR